MRALPNLASKRSLTSEYGGAFLNRRQTHLSHAYEKDRVASRIELAGLWAGRRYAHGGLTRRRSYPPGLYSGRPPGYSVESSSDPGAIGRTVSLERAMTVLTTAEGARRAPGKVEPGLIVRHDLVGA